MAPKQKPFTWSWSSLTQFENCPAQYYRLRIKKDISEKPSAEMMEGNRVHKALELRLKNGKPLPKDLRRFEGLMRKVEDGPGEILTEERIGITRDLEPCGFFDKNVWLRAVLDLTILKGTAARIIDYKTGKRKPNSEQLMLFAGVAFAKYPKLLTAGTAFWWLKTKETDKDSFEREESVPLIWQEFLPRVQEVEDAHKSGYFPEKRSGLCRGWCPVVDCENWEPKE